MVKPVRFVLVPVIVILVQLVSFPLVVAPDPEASVQLSNAVIVPEPINRSLVVKAFEPPVPDFAPAFMILVIPEFTPLLYQYFFQLDPDNTVIESISASSASSPARNFALSESEISVEGMISVKNKSIPNGLFAMNDSPSAGR